MTLASRMRWTEPVHSAQVNDAPRIRCGHRRTLARSGALGLALALIALSAPRGAIAQADPVDPVDPPAPAPSDPGADASPPASPGEPPDAPREGAGGLGGGLGAAPADSPPAPEAEPEAIPAAPGAVPPAPGASPPGQSATLRLIVIDAAPYQVDPAVGRHVSHRLRVTAAEMGYAVLTAEQSVAAAQALRMPYPPAPADLWRVTHAAGAERGVFARVWAHQGLYVVEVVVASLDGTGPFFARGTASAERLHEVVAGLIGQALPPSTRWNEAERRRLVEGLMAAPAPPPPRAQAWQAPPAPRPTPRPPETRPQRRFDLAVQTEAAIGVSSDGFYNHLFGLRLGYRITRAVHLGVYLGYANLRGRNGRASNLLSYLQVEHRVRVSAESDITVPLRFGLGYLPFNGPFYRLGLGLNIPIGPRLELSFDGIVPTFWMLDDRTVISMDLSAELIYRL